MLTTKNTTTDNWSWVDKDWNICFEDGTRRPLQFNDVVFDAGKYKGKLLSEVEDRGYLEWVLNEAENSENVFVIHCVQQRLEDL